MKKDIVNIVKILGIGCSEILMDIELTGCVINSVELVYPNTIIIHKFSDDIDFEFNLEDFDYVDQRIIHNVLSLYLYN